MYEYTNPECANPEHKNFEYTYPAANAALGPCLPISVTPKPTQWVSQEIWTTYLGEISVN